jgi:DNA-binding NarL/FixJ family response regulator
MIHVALIHAQPIYRQGLALLLENNIQNLQVVGQGRNLRELIDDFVGETVDVVIWEIPNHHVLTPGTRVLRDRFPLAKILVLVSNSNPIYAGLLETLGVNAVLPTNCIIDELFETLWKAHKEHTPHASSNHVQEPLVQVVNPRLDKFELAVLQLLANGTTDSEIAVKLYLKKEKIHECKLRLKRKLRAGDKPTLIKRALELKLIEPK